MKTITLYGKMLAFSRLKISSSDLDEIKIALAELQPTSKTIPTIIEMDKAVQAIELVPLIELLWEHKLSVIGVIDGVLNEQAYANKLAIFPADGKRIAQVQPEASKPAIIHTSAHTSATVMPNINTDNIDTPDNQLSLPVIADDTPNHAPQTATQPTDTTKTQGITSTVHEQMLRSGQTITHFGGDLIITGSINNGAEAITDNNLHIYGKASGRLIAGATGDQAARIFCQKFDPTLVSVAGTYCLRDDIPAEMLGKAVQVSFDETKGLIFTLMKG
ncbi:MAG: septum site-determining protein MinC [Moraxella sp.]|nr:septum site-determining protein MinC [Moraxella sp.]